MLKTNFRLSNVIVQKKPNDKIKANQYSNTSDYQISLKQLSTMIQDGRAFWGGNFEKENIQNAKSYLYNQILVLDIDDGTLRMKDALNNLNKYGLMPNIYYITFSGFEDIGNKYRLIYYIGKTRSKKIMKTYLYMLEKVMKTNVDKQCYQTQHTQMWQPTDKKVNYTNGNILDFTTLYLAYKDAYYKKHPSKNMNAISSETGLGFVTTTNGMSMRPNIELIDTVPEKEEYVQLDENLYLIIHFNKKVIKKDFNLETTSSVETLIRRCNYMNQLLNGKLEKLPEYAFLWKIAYNMSKIQGGTKSLLEVLDSYEYKNKKKLEHAMNNTFKNSEYVCNCESICPYYEQCTYKNILNISKRAKDDVIVLKQEKEEEDTEKIYKQLYNRVKKIIKKNDTNIVDIVNVETGIGKTTAIKNLFNDDNIYLDNCLIAEPTHKMCIEVKDGLYETKNMRKRDEYDDEEEWLYINKRPVISDDVLEMRLQNLEEQGMTKEMFTLMNEYMSECYKKYTNICINETMENDVKKYLEDNPTNKEVKQYLITKYKNIKHTKMEFKTKEEEYRLGILNEDTTDEEIQTFTDDVINKLRDIVNIKKWMELFYTASDSHYIITTHSGLNHRNITKYDNIKLLLIDEDPLKSFINNYNIELSKLQEILEKIENKVIKQSLLDIIEKGNDGIIKNNKRCLNPKEEAAVIELKEKYDINLIRFFRCDYYYIKNGKLNYCIVNKLNLREDQKVIVFTATPAPDMLLKIMFKDKEIKQHTFDKCKFQGELLQMNNFKVYHNTLEKKETIDKICDIMKKFNMKNIIPPKKTAEEFRKRGMNCVMWLGNAIGTNDLTGQDITIISQSIPDSYACHLMEAIVLNKSIYINEFEDLKLRTIVMNDVEQNVMCYNSEIKNEYLEYVIYSDQIQAIGRARLIRNNCRVLLISSYVNKYSKLI